MARKSKCHSQPTTVVEESDIIVPRDAFRALCGVSLPLRLADDALTLQLRDESGGRALEQRVKLTRLWRERQYDNGVCPGASCGCDVRIAEATARLAAMKATS